MFVLKVTASIFSVPVYRVNYLMNNFHVHVCVFVCRQPHRYTYGYPIWRDYWDLGEGTFYNSCERSVPWYCRL